MPYLTPVPPPVTAPAAPRAGLEGQDPLREAAIKLEASFLAEMLKSAGLGEARSGFGGGAGEEQFSSFLVQAQAEQMARTSGIGLAESFYHALKETQNE
ncbi:rod-binding protein [Cribrihabitans neustonicus]|uniref:rod-binding protein n=1 Tax=Cribrihabitans neustonicus TaxID=1429085 RepID=UPI003B5A5D47